MSAAEERICEVWLELDGYIAVQIREAVLGTMHGRYSRRPLLNASLNTARSSR